MNIIICSWTLLSAASENGAISMFVNVDLEIQVRGHSGSSKLDVPVWHFRGTWRHRSRERSTLHRPSVVLWNQASISNGYRDMNSTANVTQWLTSL